MPPACLGQVPGCIKPDLLQLVGIASCPELTRSTNAAELILPLIYLPFVTLHFYLTLYLPCRAECFRYRLSPSPPRLRSIISRVGSQGMDSKSHGHADAGVDSPYGPAPAGRQFTVFHVSAWPLSLSFFLVCLRAYGTYAPLRLRAYETTNYEPYAPGCKSKKTS